MKTLFGTFCVVLPVIALSQTETWPGSESVEIVDKVAEFGENLSGLVYDGNITDNERNILWAVQNNPSTLYKLLWNKDDQIWTSDTKNGWDNGKMLKWMDGTGNPDTEDLVIPAVIRSQLQQSEKSKLQRSEGVSLSDIYMCTERNDVDGEDGISRMSILRFATDTLDSTAVFAASGSGSGSKKKKKKKKKKSTHSIVAAQEWKLNDKLPVVGDNLGLEGITWIPDQHLVEQGFVDQSTGGPYDPSMYPAHNAGVFVVGLENNGVAYLFVLNEEDSSSTLIGSFNSDQGYIMSLHYDAANRYLWTLCDNTCDSVTQTVFGLKYGSFDVLRSYSSPNPISGMNIEGFTMTPESLCTPQPQQSEPEDSSSNDDALFKPVFWADDGNDMGHSIRQGTVPCGQFL